MKYTDVVKSFSKRADAANDAIAAGITGGALNACTLGVGGGLAKLGGAIAGVCKNNEGQKYVEDIEKNPALSWIPGVGAYRYQQRAIADAVANKSSAPRALAVSEDVGTLGAAVAPTLLGTGVGGLIGGGKGALVGGIAGAGVSAAAQLLGGIIGMSRRKRNPEESKAYNQDVKSALLYNYLLPGSAAYNKARRMKSVLARDYAVADKLKD